MDEKSHYSVVEVEEIVSSLTEIDRFKLLKTLRHRGPERVGWNEEDLLHHTLSELLDGNRKWKREVKPVTCISMAAKSILNNMTKNQKLGHSTPHINVEDPDAPDQVVDEASADKSSVIEKCVDDVFALFDESKDKDVLCILRNMLDEIKKASILTVCKLSENMYDAGIKKLKYRALKAFPNGLRHWDIQS